jgi:serine/threonine protein kinase
MRAEPGAQSLALELTMVISPFDWMARLDTEPVSRLEFRTVPARAPVAKARALEFRDPFVGQLLAGRYHVLRQLGGGSAGVVYLAEHLRIRRKVAIKIMLPQLTAASEANARFRREAQVSALVRNDHLVAVTDIGKLEDGLLFLAMEYLEGPDVAQLVAAEGPLCVPRVAEIGLQLCSALDAVHRAGIVHRDLKPEHVFLVPRAYTADFVKVVDFGICKFVSSGSVTAAGISLGTPRFMAPEQLEARPDVDARVDLYALGGILFFMLTGGCPFEASSLPELLMRVWSEPAPRLRDLRPDAPGSLDVLIDRALQKDRSARPTMREFQAALAAFAPSRSASA